MDARHYFKAAIVIVIIIVIGLMCLFFISKHNRKFININVSNMDAEIHEYQVLQQKLEKALVETQDSVVYQKVKSSQLAKKSDSVIITQSHKIDMLQKEVKQLKNAKKENDSLRRLLNVINLRKGKRSE